MYRLVGHEINLTEIFLEEATLAILGGERGEIEGSITLSFGSFADPTNIPVILEDVSLVAPSVTVLGFPSGPTLARLPLDAPLPELVYDSETQQIDTLTDEGMALVIDNQLDFALETQVFSGLTVNPDGTLVLVAEAQTAAPTLPETQNPERISVGQPGRLASGVSGQPAVSSDGRFLAFASRAVNLVPGDSNSANDIFVRDRVTGRMERVSVSTSGIQANGNSFLPSISSDGTVVAFVSEADNLVPDDVNNSLDVFVHNRHTHDTVRVSVHSSSAEANGTSTSPAISGDGRYVAFSTVADNLVDNDTNTVRDVLVHDLQTGITTRVSTDSTAAQANGSSDGPAVSADGRYVAFSSNAVNLVSMDDNSAPDIFVHDRDTGITTRISVSTSGDQHNGFFAFDPTISADGRYVAYSSDADNLDVGSSDNNGLDDIYVHDRQTHSTTRISINASQASGNGDHLGPVISADGRFVAYTSDSDDLVAGDQFGWRDVFVHDRNTAETTRISVDSNGVQGNDDSGIFTDGLAISGDGHLVFFESLANNLDTNDTNGAQDILVRDRQMNTTSLAVISSLPAEANGRNSSPASSFDGRVVAYASLATNLVNGDTNGFKDVFIRDRNAASTTRVSVNAGGVEANDTSDSPAVSDDGQFVAFESYATNLVEPDANDQPDIYLHNRTTGDIERINVTTAGAQANDMSFNPSLAADAMEVAFVSYATNLVSGDTNVVRDVFVRDRKTGQTTRISVNTAGEEGNDDSGELRFTTDSRYISADGRFVAFESSATNLVTGDLNLAPDIFVHDRMTGETTRVTVSSTGEEGNGGSTGVSISADGRLVAFASDASNLVANDMNTVTDVFVHDRMTGLTGRVSVNAAGVEGNGVSFRPSISADGRRILFASDATNLVTGDTNLARDIFEVDLTTGRIRRVSVDQRGDQANSGSDFPAMSPDGLSVGFVTDADNLIADDTNQQHDVYVRDLRLPSMSGDFDGDGDSDLLDYSISFGCLTGPGTLLAFGCDLADFDGNGVVDMADVARFQNSFTGRGPGLAVSSDFPVILQAFPMTALSGESIPKPFAVVSQDDLVDVVVTLANPGPAGFTNVIATLTTPPLSGITVMSGPVSYGNITAGSSAPAMFRIQTDNAVVAVHELTLRIVFDGGSRLLTVLLPVWGIDHTVIDVAGGVVEGQVATPMTTNTIGFVGPEVFDAMGRPLTFDLQSLDDVRVFNEPFFGVHWGDALGNAPVPTTSAASSQSAATVDVHTRVKTKSGAPIPGAKVKLIGTQGIFEQTSNADGEVWFRGIPAGRYSSHVDPPVLTKKVYRRGWTPGLDPTWRFDIPGVSTYSGGGWTYPDIPTGATTSGGAGGGAAAGGGGTKTKKSAVGGSLIAIGTAGVDLLAGLKTWGLTLLSLGASGLVGAGSGVLDDPVDMDIFYAGEENTVPATPEELTLSESVSMTFNILQAPIGEQNLIAESSWVFTRVTDAQTYTWSASETVDAPVFLRLRNVSATLNGGGNGVIVATEILTPGNVALRGGDVVVSANLGRFDGFLGLGMGLLRDDGQVPDQLSGDGVYTALLPIPPGQGLPLDVAIFAIKTGFEDHEIPPLIGTTMVDVTP